LMMYEIRDLYCIIHYPLETYVNIYARLNVLQNNSERLYMMMMMQRAKRKPKQLRPVYAIDRFFTCTHNQDMSHQAALSSLHNTNKTG
jgi:hypothetical protein